VRAVEAPTPVIAKINVLKDRDLALGEADRVRLRRYVAFAIKHILGSAEPFFSHEDDKQRRAVAYLEEREPRLAVCVSRWGGCALLSRGLQHRRPRRRETVAVAAAGAVSPEGGDGGGDGVGESEGTGAGDGEDHPVQATEEQRQEDFLSQL